MKTVIVYFHGYGSSPTTDKVELLRKYGEVHAWPIDLDPDISIPFLMGHVESLLLDNLHANKRFVFVGTSLGAWYAQRLGFLYNIPAILINPSYEPSRSLERYGVPDHIRAKYPDIGITRSDNIVVAADDEIIDHRNRDHTAANSITWFETGGHRFNGPEFLEAVGHVLSLIR